MQLLPLGRQTTSASDRMSLRPKNFPVRQYELRGDLLLILSSRMRPKGPLTQRPQWMLIMLRRSSTACLAQYAAAVKACHGNATCLAAGREAAKTCVEGCTR